MPDAVAAPVRWAAEELLRALRQRDVEAAIGSAPGGFTIRVGDGRRSRRVGGGRCRVGDPAGDGGRPGAAAGGRRHPRLGLRHPWPGLCADRAGRPGPPCRGRPVRPRPAAGRAALGPDPQHRPPVLLGGGGQGLVPRPPVLARLPDDAGQPALQPVRPDPGHGLQLPVPQQLHPRRLFLLPVSLPARPPRLRRRRRGADAGGARGQSRDPEVHRPRDGAARAGLPAGAVDPAL